MSIVDIPPFNDKLALRNDGSQSNFRFTRVLETQFSIRKAGVITQRETDYLKVSCFLILRRFFWGSSFTVNKRLAGERIRRQRLGRESLGGPRAKKVGDRPQSKEPCFRNALSSINGSFIAIIRQQGSLTIRSGHQKTLIIIKIITIKILISSYPKMLSVKTERQRRRELSLQNSIERPRSLMQLSGVIERKSATGILCGPVASKGMPPNIAPVLWPGRPIGGSVITARFFPTSRIGGLGLLEKGSLQTFEIGLWYCRKIGALIAGQGSRKKSTSNITFPYQKGGGIKMRTSFCLAQNAISRRAPRIQSNSCRKGGFYYEN
jgi:hypothetical protein